MNKIDYSLYLVTDRGILRERDLCECIEQSIIGGATVIQLREKNISTLEFYNIATKVKKVTSKYNVPLIINDRVDIALACDADGVHVGQSDLPLEIVRRLVGKDKIIGVSTRTVEEAEEAQSKGADYIGVGAIFATGSKDDAVTIGLTELKRIKDKVSIPIVAIGGLNEGNCSDAISNGADGIAVISAILGKDDIKLASQNLRNLIRR